MGMDQNEIKENASRAQNSGEPFSSNHLHDHSSPVHTFDAGDRAGPRLLITLVLNLLIPAAQIVGGTYARSMALISDAVHNFSDFTAILIAYFAFRMGKKGASPQNTFGYKRAEILGAVINVALLFGIDHPILQFETALCGNGSLLCELSCGKQDGQRVMEVAETIQDYLRRYFFSLHLRILSLRPRVVAARVWLPAATHHILDLDIDGCFE